MIVKAFVVASLLLASLTCCLTLSSPRTAPDMDDKTREAASRQFADGNFRDALENYLALTRASDASGQTLADDWNYIVQCLQRLRRSAEIDALREELLTLHPQQLPFLMAAASSLQHGEHYGFIVAGEFYRGDQRGGGTWTDSTERDRVRALQILLSAMPLAKQEEASALTAQYYWLLAETVSASRYHNEAWKLQILSDLTRLPDYDEYENRWQRGWGDSGQRGAPVDENGAPVYYDIPESWESASNDGQRWRWAMEQAASAQPEQYRNTADQAIAGFLHSQFGVQTLVQWSGLFDIYRSTPSEETEDETSTEGPFTVFTLKDNETIAQLATGVKRFEMPDAYNPIRWFERLAERDDPNVVRAALQQLAQIYEDRQQYPKAAEYWRKAIALGNDRSEAQKRLAQIVEPWGLFETAGTQAAQSGAQLEFRFRNGTEVNFTAQTIDIETFLADIKTYLKSDPRELDWRRIQLESLGYSILEKNLQKYVGKQVAEWTLPLEARPDHFDKRITITTPLQKAGAYLLTAKMKDGNRSHIVLWVADTTILRKPVDGQWLYYVADAVTGQPIPEANVEFFGWNSVWDDRSKRSRIKTSGFAEITDRDGFALPNKKLLAQDLQWISIARTNAGRLAFLGFNNAWSSPYDFSTYQATKVYGITDRPIYRPGQDVKFKFWLRETSYGQIEKHRFADTAMTLTVMDSQGNEVFSEVKSTDASAGVGGEFSLPAGAGLGQYTLRINDLGNRQIGSQISFRVEEYKKPEFEVTVTSPEKPIRLGEKIPVTISAEYYFGGPVQQGTVQYKVYRSAKDQRWFPIRQWDWLYGNGYAWLGVDQVWYPGFSRWGCFCPVPPWWNNVSDPPELVLDEEAKLDANGQLTFEIDTLLAKTLHGNQDHEYRVTAEVVDSSRRTIVGEGQVTVTRKPFAVYVWADRGYGRIGDVVEVSMKARTAEGLGVAGKGTLSLLKINYDDQGHPTESEIQSWPVTTDADGQASLKIKATEAGQFRLTLVLADDQQNEIEGAQLFQVVGEGFDSAKFRYNDLEILTEKSEYAPGEKVKLLVNSNRTNARILLWVRPQNSYQGRPQILQLNGKSTAVELDVTAEDMPNFFVEATTIFDAQVHEVVREIFVPPVQKVVHVEIEPAQPTVLPGEEAPVKLKLTDAQGRPFVGPVVMTMYDRSIEYISGGSNVGDIREFFWKWKRAHYPQTEHSLFRQGGNLVADGDTAMQFLGAFGSIAADSGRPQTTTATRGMLGAELREDAAFFAPGAMGGGGGGRSADSMELMSRSAAPMAKGLDGNGEGEAPLQEPVIRKDFADAAYWNSDLIPDGDGVIQTTIRMPENLTAWKLRAWAMGNQTDVGEATAEIVTAKNIMVRLQAPRFFVEKDEVVLSAIVHNYFDVAKTAEVSLAIDGKRLQSSESLQRTVELPAGGEVRVDWMVRAIAEGDTSVTMSAKTDVESDAMQMTFPVLVHGMLKTDSYSGVARTGEPSVRFLVNVPEERRPEQTRLEVRFSPTLAGAMVDALPYLVEYPYGCTEQTLNRFLPTVTTLNILREMKLDLETIRDKRTNLNAQELGDPAERARRWQAYQRNPVFDPEEVELMAKTGVQDLTKMQNSDGGWGWFSGYGEQSWPHTTAVVVRGLTLAQANGIGLVPGTLENGIAWLQRYQDEQVQLLQEGVRISDLPANQRPDHTRYRTQANELDALVYLTLTEAEINRPEMADFLYRDRNRFSPYGMALVGLAFDNVGDEARRDMLIRNVDQFVTTDAENQTAYVDLPNNGYWWYWYGDTIECNAAYLKLICRTDPNGAQAAGLVKFLLNNRRNGTYWKSTRDTAACIDALSDYMRRSGEISPEMTVEIVVDGEIKRAVEITPAVLFQFDNTLTMVGEDLSAGEHTIELRRVGQGNLYANAYLTNFTLEDDIRATGLEIKVQRQFYRLDPIADAEATVRGSRGQAAGQKVEKYNRVPLNSWDEVASGDLIEIELEIDSKNDYEYVIFEDMKAAGCEPVELRSGYVPGSLNAFVEFRDQRVSFFTRSLARGKHSFSYRMRAEIPGRFSALPTKAWAMYAPELKANSDEMKLIIGERPEVSGSE